MSDARSDLTGAVWNKSSRSSPNGQNCVEVARNLPGIVAVRDSKNPDGPRMVFTQSTWHAFIEHAQEGRFDL